MGAGSDGGPVSGAVCADSGGVVGVEWSGDVCASCYLTACGPGSAEWIAGEPEPLSAVPNDVGGCWFPYCETCEPCEHDVCLNGGACVCMFADSAHGFSCSPCRGCGSVRGGDRYPVALLTPGAVKNLGAK